MGIFKKIKNKIHVLLVNIQVKKRKKFCLRLQRKLKNKDFSLIANNCNGCILLHELGLRFNSQFVNLMIKAKDYIKYLQNFDYYQNLELNFLKEKKENYPVAKLGDITVYFVHYKNEEEARSKWEERKQRLNKDNLFVIFTEQDGCEYSDLVDFDSLPFKNKIVFTKKEYPEIKSSFFVKYYKNTDEVYMLYDYKNILSKHRKYDCFDFITWFNN